MDLVGKEIVTFFDKARLVKFEWNEGVWNWWNCCFWVGLGSLILVLGDKPLIFAEDHVVVYPLWLGKIDPLVGLSEGRVVFDDRISLMKWNRRGDGNE